MESRWGDRGEEEDNEGWKTKRVRERKKRSRERGRSE